MFNHPDRQLSVQAMMREQVGCVPAHVLAETFSVLTRSPEPYRLRGVDVRDALRAAGLQLLHPADDSHWGVVNKLADAGLGGGAVYDGLVAETARVNGLSLVTRDRRAASTYDVIGVAYTLI